MEREAVTLSLSPALEALLRKALEHWAAQPDFERKLDQILEQGRNIMSAVTDFAAKANAAFADVSTSLDNISADEAKLAKDIQALKDQIAAGGSQLTAADQAALDAVAKSATDLAARTKTIADAVPEELTA